MFLNRGEKLSLDMSDESVDVVSERVGGVCESLGYASSKTSRCRLAAEECLLRWKEALPASRFDMVVARRLRKVLVRLELKGDPMDPLEMNYLGGKGASSDVDIVRNVGCIPQYSYRGGRNRLEFALAKRRLPKFASIMLAIFAGLLMGVALKAFVPSSAIVVLLSVVNSIYAAFLRLFSCIAGPLILFSVMWGIYGIGEVSVLQRIGVKMLMAFAAFTLAVAVAGSLFYGFFGIDFSVSDVDSSQLLAILDTVLDVIPKNIVVPFYLGNTSQVIFLGFAIGLAMLYLGKKVEVVTAFTEQVGDILELLMGVISAMIPFFIFFTMARIVLSGAVEVLSGIWMFSLVFPIGCLAFTFVSTMVTALRFKVSPLNVARKCLQTFVIGLTTASSSACFESNMNTCRRRLGVSDSLSCFGVPLGIVIFHPGTTLYCVWTSFYFANAYGMDVSFAWIVSVIIGSALVTMTLCPIPGGALASYSILHSCLGIPADAMQVMVSIDIIFDFIRTAFAMYNLPLVLANVSSGVGLLNVGVMRRKLSEIETGGQAKAF